MPNLIDFNPTPIHKKLQISSKLVFIGGIILTVISFFTYIILAVTTTYPLIFVILAFLSPITIIPFYISSSLIDGFRQLIENTNPKNNQSSTDA